MMDFTLSNCKDLDVRKSTCGITKRFAILLVMMVMITSKALAGASFEVIDGFKYILDSDTKTATLVETELYGGDIVIPESVKVKDGNVYKITIIGDKCFYWKNFTSITIPSSVTSLGDDCFGGCTSLKSITIPSSVTTLGQQCFSDCYGLTSITIPSSVTYLGHNCFADCSNLESIYFIGRKPARIISNAIPKACIIYVPAEYLQDYKDALGTDYKYIYTWNPNGSGDDEKPVTQCATPSVFYGAGKLKFSCETAGAKYHYTVSDKDMATDALSEDGNVSLSAAYDISVYATADGYKTSEKAKATLYWVNANLENTTNIYQARTRGVVASAHDGIVCISGLDNGEVVKFYAADGKLIDSSSAVDGTASCAVSETMVIAKFGDNAIKVAVK